MIVTDPVETDALVENSPSAFIAVRLGQRFLQQRAAYTDKTTAIRQHRLHPNSVGNPMHVEVMRVIKNALPDPNSEEARIIAHTARERPHRDFLHVRKVIDDVEKPLAKTPVASSLPYTISRALSHPPPRHPQPETIEAHASVQMRFSVSGCSFA